LSSNLTYVYAAVVDVLGYCQRLKEDRVMGSLAFKNELQRALQALTDINEAVYSYQAISDTIILTCSNREGLVDFLQVLKEIKLAFLKEGMFIRGGVAYSQHFKSNYVTYSHAVARAHEIESIIALYPRIVIDHNIVHMFEASGEISELVKSDLISVLNGAYFLNILDRENWSDVYHWARSLYEHDREVLLRNEVEFAKHTWFENYIFASDHLDPRCERYIPTIQPLGEANEDTHVIDPELIPLEPEDENSCLF